jgi:ectoine hydroxylase-related dioxygenase (phytanoyl-CoA dioxygenase family)
VGVAGDSHVFTGVREITDTEVDFFTESGWVFLPGLFSPALAAELLEHAKRLIEAKQAHSASRFEQSLTGSRFVLSIARARVEPFRSLATSAAVATVAHRLISRVRLTDQLVPTRLLDDLIWCNEPGGDGTGYHQDSSVEAADRKGRVDFWVALDEVPPGMARLRFLTGSHRAGPLGWLDQPADGDAADPLFTRYPKLLGWRQVDFLA